MGQTDAWYQAKASEKGLSISRLDSTTWEILGEVPDTKRLIAPQTSYQSDDRVRLEDGRIFNRKVTTAELLEILGLDEEDSED